MGQEADIAYAVQRFREILTEQVKKNGMVNGAVEIRIKDAKYQNYKATKHGA